MKKNGNQNDIPAAIEVYIPEIIENISTVKYKLIWTNNAHKRAKNMLNNYFSNLKGKEKMTYTLVNDDESLLDNEEKEGLKNTFV